MTENGIDHGHGEQRVWDEMWDGCISLNAKRTGSKGYGVSEAETGSAMRPRTVAEGAPQRLRPGAHPFGPSPAAVHGTWIDRYKKSKTPSQPKVLK